MRTVSTAAVSRRTVFALGAAIGTSMVTSGCISGGSSDSAEDEPFEGTVEFWTINLKKNYGDYVSGLIRSYEKAHPKVTIKWVDVPGADIATKLLAAIASGNAPDAVNLDAQSVPRFIPSLTAIDDLLSDDELADFLPNLTNPMRRKGKLWAVPWYSAGAPVGIYRKSVVSKAGFDPANPPATYEDALALAEKVYNATDVYGMNDLPTYPVLALMGVASPAKDREKASFNTPEAAAVLEKFKKTYDRHGIAPGAVSLDERNPQQSIDNKQLAFLPNYGPFILINTKANAPDVYRDVVITKGIPNKDGRYMLNNQQTWIVPKASKHKRAAAQLIKFVTNGTNQLAFCKLNALYPSTISTTKDSYFTDVSGDSPIDQGRKVIVSELPKLTYGALGTSRDVEVTKALADQVVAFMQGRKNAAAALSAAADEWNAILAKD